MTSYGWCARCRLIGRDIGPCPCGCREATCDDCRRELADHRTGNTVTLHYCLNTAPCRVHGDLCPGPPPGRDDSG